MRLYELLHLTESEIDDIIGELDFFTASPGHPMSPQLKYYLNKLPKPSGVMKLYRVVLIDDPSELQEKTGITHEQAQIGKKVLLKLPKESSWTKAASGVQYLLRQAEDFGYEMAFVFETRINGADILVDLEMLPDSVRQQVSIDWPQKEVIVDHQQIPAVVANIIKA